MFDPKIYYHLHVWLTARNHLHPESTRYIFVFLLKSKQRLRERSIKKKPMATSLTFTTPKLTNSFSSPSLRTLYSKFSIPLSLSLPLSYSSRFPSDPTTLTCLPLQHRRSLSHYRGPRRGFASARAESVNGAETTRHYDFDLFTIGAGSGGVRASRYAANSGASVAICELPFSTISSETTGGVGGT